MPTSIRIRCARALLILACFLCALPSAARAVTVRVDWSATAVALVGGGDPIFLSGSFGDFELPDGTAFPVAIPLSVPFTVTTTFGPDPGDNVYFFSSNGGLGFAFGSAASGRLVRMEPPGFVSSTLPLPGPYGGYDEVEFEFSGDPPLAAIHLTRWGPNGGLFLIWSGPLDYAFSVVPEPASALLLSLGLTAIAARRARS